MGAGFSSVDDLLTSLTSLTRGLFSTLTGIFDLFYYLFINWEYYTAWPTSSVGTGFSSVDTLWTYLLQAFIQDGSKYVTLLGFLPGAASFLVRAVPNRRRFF